MSYLEQPPQSPPTEVAIFYKNILPPADIDRVVTHLPPRSSLCEEGAWFLSNDESPLAEQRMQGVGKLMLGVIAGDPTLSDTFKGTASMEGHVNDKEGHFLFLFRRRVLALVLSDTFSYVANKTNANLENLGSPLRLGHPLYIPYMFGDLRYP